MIITYPNYLDQTQTIGLQGILQYHGVAVEPPEISGVYGITYDKPDTHSRTYDKPATHPQTYDN